MFGDSHKTDQAQNQTDDNNNSTDTAPGLGLGSSPSTFGTPQPPTNDTPVDDSTKPILPAQDEDDKTTDTFAASDSDLPKTDDELSEIKKQALEQLSPLVHKLDQSPEEKYKTLIMMVQASDNKDLLNEAYEAAQKITDEAAKAEALLTIVNEINYFTQK